MRVIAGKHRGCVLASFQGDDIRPTADRVKESVFQILSPTLAGARVLDLFCGSGALGIECLSRGAREVVFNDVSRESLALLEKNLKHVKETGIVINRSFTACLASVGGKFDYIFSDPPYKENYLPEILKIAAERQLLLEGGLVIHEGERAEQAPDGWIKADERRYGRTVVGFFKRQSD